MATYLGVPYHAGLGPDGNEATLFSPGPPPDELGFTAAGGHWRKQVSVTALDALWQSRLVGEYRGEPCLVLDDLADRLHIVYLGRDSARARQLGYWEIDREVFEVVVAPQEVTGLTEERVEHPLTSATFPSSNRDPVPLTAQPWPEAPGLGTSGPQAPGGPPPSVTERTGPLRVLPRPDPQPSAEPGGYAETAEYVQAGEYAETGEYAQTGEYAETGGYVQAGEYVQAGGYAEPDRVSSTPDRVAAWHGSPETEPWSGRRPDPPADPRSESRPDPRADPRSESRPDPRADPRSESRPDPRAESWAEPRPWAEPEPQAAPPSGRRAGRRDRVPESVFAELLSLAAIPHAAYAVDEEVPGAMCLVKADGGFEVFSRTDDARLDVRFFEDEEAAYFYLFGVLAAEAVRSGRLRPGTPNGHANGSRGPGVPSAWAENVSKYLRGWKLPKPPSHPVIVNLVGGADGPPLPKQPRRPSLALVRKLGFKYRS
jgi:hypothetical protein